MRLEIALFAAIFVASLPVPAVMAQASVSPVADNAETLAARVLPREAIVAIRVPRFEAAYAALLKDDVRLQTLEKAHPGISKAVATVARNEAIKAYGAAVDRLRADVTQLYRARFTAAELAKLSDFFATATGQAIVAMSAEAGGDTVSEFEADRRRILRAKLQNPDEQTKADLTRLIESGLMPKMRAIAPEVSVLSARRFDDVNTMVEAALPDRVEETIASFTKKPGP